jgi:hypothetical protein
METSDQNRKVEISDTISMKASGTPLYGSDGGLKLLRISADAFVG